MLFKCLSSFYVDAVPAHYRPVTIDQQCTVATVPSILAPYGELLQLERTPGTRYEAFDMIDVLNGGHICC